MAYDAGTPRLTLRGKRVVLLLQGSGALGAYQVGPFGALAAACREASTPVAWVGGVSIGAINAAVIAGPAGGDAVAELDGLWDDILSPAFPPFDASGIWERLPPLPRSGCEGVVSSRAAAASTANGECRGLRKAIRRSQAGGLGSVQADQS